MMGNRAVISPSEFYYKNGLGIYLHWNGGLDSVQGFLTYCKLRGFRTPETDSYGMARLCQIISNFMGGDGLSIGIDTVDNLDCDNWDNGVFLTKGWDVVGRVFNRSPEQQNYDLTTFVISVDEHQPASQQLGERLIIDLLHHNADIWGVDSMYHYRIKKMKEQNQPIRGFEAGDKITWNGTTIKILSVDEWTANIEYEFHQDKKNLDVPLFHWMNGVESVLVPDVPGSGPGGHSFDSMAVIE